MLLEPIHQLLKHGDHVPYGRYKDLISDPCTSFWDIEGSFLNKKRRTQRKTWIFYGIYSENLLSGMAIVDAGMIATAFAYFYIPSENLYLEDKFTLPLGFGKHFDPSLKDEWKLGKYSIRSSDETMTLTYFGKFKLEITGNINPNGVSIVAPSEGDRPFNFTYKNLLLESDIKITHQQHIYRADGQIGSVDFTKGYPPRNTIWNWCSLNGKTESGKSIGVNLVDRFNNNMENILWLDDKRIVLSDATFEPGANLKKDPWHIHTNDQIIHLELTPMGARSENLDIKFMKSIFTQPFGKYTGSVTLNGQTENLIGYGVSEDHYALW